MTAPKKVKVAPPDGIMQTLPTGFCSNGFCEGRKINAQIPEDKPTPRCKGRFVHQHGVHKVTYCPCDCHDEVTEMYTMAGRERVWPASIHQTPRDLDLADRERSKYVFASIQTKPVITLPDNADAKAETITMEEAMSMSGGGVDDNTPRLKLIIPPNPKVPQQDRFASGRPPGQLELEVKLVCDGLILGTAATTDMELRPVTISRLIDADSPPSTGAVTNILRAWGTIGFAKIEEGPVRFCGYTVAGIELGIEPLRERYKALQGDEKRKGVLRQRENNRSGGLVAAIERRRAKGGK